MRIECELADSAATEALGGALARVLSGRGGVVYLLGDLGAGKTTLARGLLRALGVSGAVRSPTYTLLELYEVGDCPVLHMDLYRLQDPEELVALGVRDFSPPHTLWLVEWPQRGEGFLPEPSLRVALSSAGDGRRACLESEDPLLIGKLREELDRSRLHGSHTL